MPDLQEIKAELRETVTRDVTQFFDRIDKLLVRDSTLLEDLIIIKARYNTARRNHELGLLPFKDYEPIWLGIIDGVISMINQITEEEILVQESPKSFRNHLLWIEMYDHKGENDTVVGTRDSLQIIDLFQTYYGFESVSIFDHVTATLDNIIFEFDELADRLTEQDNLLIYFSGYTQPIKGKGYWKFVKDVEGNKISWDYFEHTKLIEYLEEMEASNVLLISNTHFDNNSKKSNATTPNTRFPRSRWSFYLDKSTEGTLEERIRLKQLFFESIKQQLLKNTREELSISELVNLVIEDVKDEVKCLPKGEIIKQSGHTEGEFVFYKNPTAESIIDPGPIKPPPVHLDPLQPSSSLQLEETTLWAETIAQDRVTAYLNYLSSFPDGQFVSDTHQRIVPFVQRYIQLIQDKEFSKATNIIISTFPATENQGIRKTGEIHQNRFFQDREQIDLPKMIAVEGGDFWMGGDVFERERPKHKVFLTKFKISKYPITYQQYDQFCEYTDYPLPSDNGHDRTSLPIVNVSWYDALEFCNWISEVAGLEKVYDLDDSQLKNVNLAADGYRLPTEAEWEFAARGGVWTMGYEYAGDNEIEKVGWYHENADERSHAVGQFKGNELGIHDMSGNVCEWCHDFWNHNYYKRFNQTTVVNPKGPEGGFHRIIRGGAFTSKDIYCRVAYRDSSDPKEGLSMIGFRVARNG